MENQRDRELSSHGLRWQSAAATALSGARKRRGAPFPAAVQELSGVPASTFASRAFSTMANNLTGRVELIVAGSNQHEWSAAIFMSRSRGTRRFAVFDVRWLETGYAF